MAESALMDEAKRAAQLAAANASLEKANQALDELVALYKAQLVRYSNQNLPQAVRVSSFLRETIQKDKDVITPHEALLALAIERLADLT